MTTGATVWITRLSVSSASKSPKATAPAKRSAAGPLKETRWAAWRASIVAVARHAGQRSSVRSRRARPLLRPPLRRSGLSRRPSHNRLQRKDGNDQDLDTPKDERW